LPDEYWFVVVEKEPPYLTAVHKLPEQDIEWGRIINRISVATFDECRSRNEWPGYRPIGARGHRAFVTGLPKWAQYRLNDMMEAGQLRPPEITDADKRRAAKLHAPDMEREYLP
jgi:hypothetical protein